HTVVPAAQTISFAPLADATYGEPDFDLVATATSGLPVAFSVSGNCTLAGSTPHLTGAGSCSATASQGGSSNYRPAPDVTQSFHIAKAGQTISFAPIADVTYGDPAFDLFATASSGLPVSFSVAIGPCLLSGNSVAFVGGGSCTITAFQPGDDNYFPAGDVSQSFTINRAAQTISFGTLGDQTFGDPDFGVDAVATSGLPVALAADGAC